MLLPIFEIWAGSYLSFEKLEYFIAELWNQRGIIKRDIFLLHAFPVSQELNAQQSVVN